MARLRTPRSKPREETAKDWSSLDPAEEQAEGPEEKGFGVQDSVMREDGPGAWTPGSNLQV